MSTLAESPIRPRESIGGAERVERDWEEREAERRWEAFVERRGDQLADRERERERLSIGQRLDFALRVLHLRAGGRPAGAIAASRGGGDDDHPSVIPRDSTGTDARMAEVEGRINLIRHHVRYIEATIDADDGLLRTEPDPEGQGFYGQPGVVSAYGATRMIKAADRDRLIVDEFEGVRSDVVAREEPALDLSARSVERARVREGRRRGLRIRPVDGRVVGPLEDGPPRSLGGRTT